MTADAISAAIIDVGARSYGKDARDITPDEELRRLIPVIDALRRDEIPLPLSVDTVRWRIAQLALDSGASIINDCSGTGDPFMMALAARTGAALILMHNPVALITGTPREYENVVDDVTNELEAMANAAPRSGVDGASIVLDPGLEFGKRPSDDLALLMQFERLTALGYPMLLAASRKRFVHELTGANTDALLPASLAAVALAVERGALIVRAHDVAETVQFLRVFRPNPAEAAQTLGKKTMWTSTSNSPKQAFSSRTRTTRSNGTRRAASSA